MLTHLHVKIGDRARFPLGRLGDEQTYRHSFEAVAFRNGLIVVRRLADGYTREITPQWWEEYTLDYRPKRYSPVRPHLPLPRLNGDRNQPGFYVSILHAHKPGAYILAAGPFSYPGDARRLVVPVKALIDRQYGSSREWWDLRVGVCRAEDGAHDGRFNAELGVVS